MKNWDGNLKMVKITMTVGEGKSGTIIKTFIIHIIGSSITVTTTDDVTPSPYSRNIQNKFDLKNDDSDEGDHQDVAIDDPMEVPEVRTGRHRTEASSMILCHSLRYYIFNVTARIRK